MEDSRTPDTGSALPEAPFEILVKRQIARLLEPQRKLQRGVLWRLRLAQCSHEWRLAWRGGYRSGSGPGRVLVDRMVEGGLLLLLQPPR